LFLWAADRLGTDLDGHPACPVILCPEFEKAFGEAHWQSVPNQPDLVDRILKGVNWQAFAFWKSPTTAEINRHS
jgi:hypothetical protein